MTLLYLCSREVSRAPQSCRTNEKPEAVIKGILPGWTEISRQKSTAVETRVGVLFVAAFI